MPYRLQWADLRPQLSGSWKTTRAALFASCCLSLVLSSYPDTGFSNCLKDCKISAPEQPLEIAQETGSFHSDPGFTGNSAPYKEGDVSGSSTATGLSTPIMGEQDVYGGIGSANHLEHILPNITTSQASPGETVPVRIQSPLGNGITAEGGTISIIRQESGSRKTKAPASLEHVNFRSHGSQASATFNSLAEMPLSDLMNVEISGL